jgi:hypothetical protein
MSFGIWTEWRQALVLVQPATVVAWHRRGFRLFWTWKSGQAAGRPTIPAGVRAPIRMMQHDAYHAGHIAILKKVLGFPRAKT